jgi:putative transposase
VEQRRQIVNQSVQAGLSTKIALPMAGLSRSTYYYKPNHRKGGKKPSSHTFKRDGSCVTNDELIKVIESICERPFIDYGANRMALKLKKLDFVINKKKVYRLMKEKKLLYPKVRKANADRQFVKYTVPDSNAPFETIEIDIKYIYIQGEAKTAYLITAIDTFTRIAMAWELAYKMKAIQVAELVQGLIHKLDYGHRAEKYFIRTDNGPQFIAKKLQESMVELPFNHEFIQPGTPQQNGHVESFHSTVSRLVVSKYEFESIEQARKVFEAFYDTYNNERIMTGLLGYAPKEFYRLWCDGGVMKVSNRKKTKFILREKPDKGHGSSLEDLIGVSLNYSE